MTVFYSMKKTTRYGLFLAALLLIPVFLTPIWSITLKAPQYPQGLGMYIWVNDITGHERHDIRNINILNHYVGMKEIEPGKVGTLDVMPWVVGGLMAMAVISALAGKLWLAWIWVALFIAAGVAGMVDFYMWGYDYGHNLNPRAAIKVPGMSYQPPLIGKKTLLNITATSWPYWGSLWIVLSLTSGLSALVRETFIQKTIKKNQGHLQE